MSASLSGEGRSSETDNISALELQSNRRMLYFSDGVMEEPSSDSESDADVPDKSYNVQVNELELPLVPRLRYKACKLGNNILAGIDYVGGGLASFLGITTSKYASELEYYKRAKAQSDADAAEESLDNWHSAGGANNNNNRNDAIIRCEPASSEANAPPPQAANDGQRTE